MAQTEYDISLAVQALRTFLEIHTHEECRLLIFQPTQFWLRRLAAEDPEEVVCLRAKSLSSKHLPGFSCEVFFVHADKVIYLATILSKERAEVNLKRLQEIFPLKSDKLEEQGLRGMWLSSACYVPIDESSLTDQNIGDGLQRCFKSLAPKLAGVPVSWLPAAQQEKITEAILLGAMKTRKRQTHEECMKIAIRDVRGI